MGGIEANWFSIFCPELRQPCRNMTVFIIISSVSRCCTYYTIHYSTVQTLEFLEDACSMAVRLIGVARRSGGVVTTPSPPLMGRSLLNCQNFRALRRCPKM